MTRLTRGLQNGHAILKLFDAVGRIRQASTLRHIPQQGDKVPPYRLLSIPVLVISLAGCASTQETRTTSVVQTFPSAKTAQDLTICIDKNTDGRVWNSLRTNVKSFGGEKFEIVVRNGDFIWSIVQVEPAPPGAVAAIRLGGAATVTPDGALEIMTKDCG